MIRSLLPSLAIVCCLTLSAQAAITLDGRIGDWEQAGLLSSDLSNDRKDANAAAEMLRYGATIQNGTFYAVIEINRPVSDFNGVYKAKRLYLDAFIDADHSTTTALNGLDSYNATAIAGTDILLEWGRNRRTPPVNFWGAGNNINNIITTNPDGLTETGAAGALCADTDGGLDGHGLAGHGVLEWSCPVSSITAALATLPGNVSSGTAWRVKLAVQGTTDQSTYYGYGYDYANLAGDANWSGTTDATDLNTVLSYYNQSGRDWSTGDFNADGTTDATDLNTVLSYYNHTTDVVVGGSSLTIAVNQPVPEPSCVALLIALAASLGVWTIRRR